jgi:hypothetical protein
MLQTIAVYKEQYKKRKIDLNNFYRNINLLGNIITPKMDTHIKSYINNVNNLNRGKDVK